MADAADSKSAAPCGRVGSTPISGTKGPLERRPWEPKRRRGTWTAPLLLRTAGRSTALLGVSHVHPGGGLVRALLGVRDAHVVANLEVAEGDLLAQPPELGGVVGLEGRDIAAVLDGERLSGGVDRGDVAVHAVILLVAALRVGGSHQSCRKHQEQCKTQGDVFAHDYLAS